MPKLSVTKIKTQIAKLQKQLVSAENQKQPAIRKVLALMQKLGVTLADLRGAEGAAQPKAAGRKAAGRKLGSVPVKYRDENGNTWTGRGRTPRWLVEAEAGGKNRQQFQV